MKTIKLAFKNLFVLATVMALFSSCDKDFVSLDSEIAGETDFEVADSKYEVIAYNHKLNPVQTNALPANLFGFYKDLTYGSFTANVVTQLAPTSFDPNFPVGITLDSVVLTVPYFSKAVSLENEKTKYKLDSVYGSAPINFKIYENVYFLRSFDPSLGFDRPQKYYSDRSLSASNQIPLPSLQWQMIYQNPEFRVSDQEIILKQDENDKPTRIAPAMRIKLDMDFWNDKIILKKGQPELSNLNNFQNYFRGLYFEASPSLSNDGSMLLLNFAATTANVTIYYSSPATGSTTDQIEGSYRMNFSGNRANFFDNNFTTAIPQGNPTTGDANLYLKGGQGSMALIDLFGGTNSDGNNGSLNAFESFKNDFVTTDATGKFLKAKRLINEANLVFEVDQTLTNGQEPDRIFIYDTKNGIPLFDYTFDSADQSNPNNSRINHLGKLKRVGNTANGKGVKYKLKITEHIKNLLQKDSTNVTLGLTVSTNVDTEGSTAQRAIQSPDANMPNYIPVSAILSPRGTVLYGSNPSDQSKKIYLEIFYTEPNN